EPSLACPDENTIVALVSGSLPAQARAHVEGHLARCAECRKLVSDLAQSSWGSQKEAAEAPTEPRPARGRPLAPGEVVGPYVVLAQVGAGGMGVVYAAYDPRLDRKIALKVLRSELAQPDATRDVSADDRLLREAQAMARVSHPNVVTVHDVGTFEQQ